MLVYDLMSITPAEMQPCNTDNYRHNALHNEEQIVLKSNNRCLFARIRDTSERHVARGISGNLQAASLQARARVQTIKLQNY